MEFTYSLTLFVYNKDRKFIIFIILLIVVRSTASSPTLDRDRELQNGQRHRPMYSNAAMIGFTLSAISPPQRVVTKRYRTTGSYRPNRASYIFKANGKITTPVTCNFKICALKCMESNNLDQLGEARRRRVYSHTARRINFSHKSNRGVNFASLFSMDLYRQYFGGFTSEVAWRFYHTRTVLENKYCINQEVLLYYLAA